MFGRALGEISPRVTTDSRPTFNLHYLVLPAAQPDKVDIGQLGLQPYPQPAARETPRPHLG